MIIQEGLGGMPQASLPEKRESGLADITNRVRKRALNEVYEEAAPLKGESHDEPRVKKVAIGAYRTQKDEDLEESVKFPELSDQEPVKRIKDNNLIQQLRCEEMVESFKDLSLSRKQLKLGRGFASAADIKQIMVQELSANDGLVKLNAIMKASISQRETYLSFGGADFILKGELPLKVNHVRSDLHIHLQGNQLLISIHFEGVLYSAKTDASKVLNH